MPYVSAKCSHRATKSPGVESWDAACASTPSPIDQSRNWGGGLCGHPGGSRLGVRVRVLAQQRTSSANPHSLACPEPSVILGCRCFLCSSLLQRIQDPAISWVLCRKVRSVGARHCIAAEVRPRVWPTENKGELQLLPGAGAHQMFDLC